MIRILKYSLIVLAAIGAAVLLYQFRVVLLVLLISLAVTAISRPLLVYLGDLHVPGFLAQLLILIVLLAAVGGFILLAGPKLSAEIQHLTNYSLIWYYSAYQVWEGGASWQQIIASRLPEPGNLADYFLGTNGQLLLPAAINLTQNLAAFFSRLFIVLTFSLYWAQDQDRLIRMWLSLLPANQRIPMYNTWQTVEKAVGRYLRYELALGLIAAVLLGTGYTLLGQPYPTTLALLAFFGWFIPILGFTIILIPVYITASVLGWGVVVVSIVFTLSVLIGLKYWIEPKYLHPRLYSSFLIVFWIVVLGSFLGLGGYLAGPVVAVATQALWRQYVRNRSRSGRVETQLATLRERYTEAHEHYGRMSRKHPSPQLGSLFDRLERFLNQTGNLAEGRFNRN